MKARRENSADKVLDGLRIALEARKDKSPNITIHNHPGEQPEIKFEPVVNVPEYNTPVINVNVDPTPVNVTVKPSTAKINNVVNIPKEEKIKAKIKRDQNGIISGIEEE